MQRIRVLFPKKLIPCTYLCSFSSYSVNRVLPLNTSKILTLYTPPHETFSSRRYFCDISKKDEEKDGYDAEKIKIPEEVVIKDSNTVPTTNDNDGETASDAPQITVFDEMKGETGVYDEDSDGLFYGESIDKELDEKQKRIDQYLRDRMDHDRRNVNEVAASIDTTLTPAQQEYVAKLRKMVRGGKPYGPKSPDYIRKTDELDHTGMFITNMPENANDLVNWAWSHLPKKMGTRGTRKKKRMSLKWARKRLRDKTIKEQKKRSSKEKRSQEKENSGRS